MGTMKRATISRSIDLRVRALGQSATLAIHARCRALAAEGKRVYRMGLGQSPFPVPNVVVEHLVENAHQKDYLPVEGLPELRQAVAAYHRRTQQLDRSADGVLVGPGSKELMFILQLVFYGDLVIPTPSWVSYAPQAHILGRRVCWVSTSAEEGWRLSPERLESLCRRDPDRPRLVILNYPNNPTGGSYAAERLRQLASVARRYRVLLLSDEIYGELHHTGKHVSVARFYPEGTIVSGGLSKWCGAGGWRLGTFLFPPQLAWLRERMAVVASETYSSAAAPIQHAAVRAFQGGPSIERYLRQSRRILRALTRHVAHVLRDEGAQVSAPEGAFYLFPDLSPLRERLATRGIHTSAQLCERLLEDTGVAALPGSDFGRPAEELTLRIATVDFDGARALAEAERHPPDRPLGKPFLQDCCGPVVEAADRMAAWMFGD
jgi:aspartate aminotransferase